MPVKPIPEGFHTLTPNLVCKNAAGAIDFYIKVFGAKELSRVPGPHGEIMHAELQIGDTRIFINDTMSTTGPHTPASGESNPMYLHVLPAGRGYDFQPGSDGRGSRRHAIAGYVLGRSLR